MDATACDFCPAHADATLTPISLAEALERFRRDAVEGTCDTGRYRCRYAVWGNGAPVLMIHGLSDRRQSFLPLMAYLAGQFRCIAYDLPRGKTDGARLSRYTPGDLVKDVFALLDHLEARQSYLFGSSFGSTIALAAARQHPERIPRLLLQGGFACRPLAPAEIWLARMARFWPGRMRHLPLRNRVLEHGHQGPFRDQPPELWQYFLEQANATPIAVVARRGLWVHELDLRPILAEIRQPVLLVGGEDDPVVPRACEEELLQGLPNARSLRLAGCGHHPLFSHPAELALIVRQFLTPPRATPCPMHPSAACPVSGGNGEPAPAPPESCPSALRDQACS